MSKQDQDLIPAADHPASLKARRQALMDNYLERLAETAPIFGLKAYRDPETEQIQIRMTDTSAWLLVARATGTANQALARRLVMQAMAIQQPPEGREQETLEEILGALIEIGPTDGLQGMAAVQIIGAHALAIRHLRSAADATHPEAQNHYWRLAEKAMSMFTKQLNGLARHRARGQPQRIIVEKVEIKQGGQGIIGNVAPGAKRGG
jgi:hypothetical protein